MVAFITAFSHLFVEFRKETVKTLEKNREELAGLIAGVREELAGVRPGRVGPQGG